MTTVALTAEGRRSRNKVLTVPNVLTMGRIIAIPLVIYRMLVYDSAEDRLVTGYIFGAAAITDLFDGYIARRYDCATKLGQVLDALSDKILVLAIYCPLLYLHQLPVWVAAVTVGRELAINGLRTLAMTENLTIPSSGGGKVKTNLQMWGAAFLIAHDALPFWLSLPLSLVPQALEAVYDCHRVGIFLTYCSIVPSLWSAGQYVANYVKVARATDLLNVPGEL